MTALAPVVAAVVDTNERSTIKDVIVAAIAGGTNTLVTRDLGLRLESDIEDVHQARVATRRLRSDLRTLRPTLSRDWVDGIRGELKWAAAALGAVRDLDVMSAMVRHEIRTLSDSDATWAGSLMHRLVAEREDADRSLLAVLDSDRYLALLERLSAAATAPPLASEISGISGISGNEPARKILPPLVHKRWKRLRRTVAGLGAEPSDQALHEVRKQAKQLRYAAELAEPVIGGRAKKLAEGVEAVQDVLGQHHDSVVAQQWLRHAATAPSYPVARQPAPTPTAPTLTAPTLAAPDPGTLVATAVAAGRVIERQYQRACSTRREWPKTWRRASKKRLRRWLTA